MAIQWQPEKLPALLEVTFWWSTGVMDMVKSLSHVWLFVSPWTVAHQAPPSMGFSRQEYWSGLLFPSPGDLLDPGIEPRFPTLQADSLTSEPPGKPRDNSDIISSNIFSGPFSLSSPSGTPIVQMFMPLMLSQRSLRLSSFLFFSFFYILYCGSDFHHSVLQVVYSFFCLSYSAIDSF